jgi:hypothetical protein
MENLGMKRICKLSIFALSIFAIANAHALTISSTVAESGANNDSNVAGVGTNGASGQNDPVPITGTIVGNAPPTVINPAGNPWTFSAAQVNQLATINSISITLTIFDGDSGSNQSSGGNFDLNNLTLGLGVPGALTTAGGQMIDTGLKLNGFDSALVNGSDITLTLSGNLAPATGAALLTLLKSPASNGQLGGLILDSNGLADSNGMVLAATHMTTLDLTGTAVPEPGTLSLLSVSLLGGVGVTLRRKRIR